MPHDDLDSRLRPLLQKYWGFDTLRPLQREAIQASLDNRDSLVILPTGGGKSLCYQVPPLLVPDGKPALCVVVSPLIALMKDQVDGLIMSGYPAAAINSTTPSDRVIAIRREILDVKLKLLFVAPERLLTESFLAFLVKANVNSFAIDEAHCISQWGHDFRPEYRRLAELRETFPTTPLHAYTATATPRVRDDIVAQLGLRNPAILTGRFDRPNLTYRVLPRISTDEQVEEVLRRRGESGGDGGAAIVYCISRKETERLAASLTSRKIKAAAYHAGMDPKKRHDVQEDFTNERLNVVVATVAFGMGIDRSDVRCVVHASMPKSVEHYQQETGRAGRDGLPSECVLLYSSADAIRWKGLMERSAAESDSPPEPQAAAAQLELLNHMQRFCSGTRCRHRALSEYFGQQYEPPAPDSTSCNACDVCLHELDTVPDSTIVAQKITSCVARLTYTAHDGQPRGYGAAYIADVLRGSRAAKITERAHDKLSTFGLLPGVDKEELVSMINQLVDADCLARAGVEFPTIITGPNARALFRSETQVALHRPRLSDAIAGASGSRNRGYTADGAQANALSPEEHALFDTLRALRRAIATEMSVPPFVVFSDATLDELARVRPGSLETLAHVRGIGQSKLTTFGDRFVNAIADHCRAKNLPLDASQGSRPRPALAAKAKGGAGSSSDPNRDFNSLPANRKLAYTMFERAESIDAAIERTQLARSTIVGYLADFIRRYKPPTVRAWVDDQTYQLIAHTADTLPPVPEPLEYHGPRIGAIYQTLASSDTHKHAADYDRIRIVVTHRESLRSGAKS